MKQSPTANTRITTPVQGRSNFLAQKPLTGIISAQTASHKGQTGGSSASAPETATGDASEQQSKVPKPSATEVSNRVFSILATSEPLSLLDICKKMPEMPRESTQNVLEVLQVLGFVVQSVNAKDSISSRSGSVSNTASVFSLTDFAKFSASFPIANVESELKRHNDSQKVIEARNSQLQELSEALDDESLSTEQRTAMLKDTIEKLLTRNPELYNDPLYQALIEQLGCANVGSQQARPEQQS